MQTEILKVTGMTCGGCASKVTAALKSIAGVTDVNVSLSDGEVQVQFNEHETNLPQLQSALERAGYGLKPERGCHGQHGSGCCCG